MHRVSIRGSSGEVRWGYHCAASVGPWTITAEGSGGTLTATVVSHDASRVSQQPLTFVVTRPGAQPWRWELATLQINGDHLIATLSPQE